LQARTGTNLFHFLARRQQAVKPASAAGQREIFMSWCEMPFGNLRAYPVRWQDGGLCPTFQNRKAKRDLPECESPTKKRSVSMSKDVTSQQTYTKTLRTV